MSILQRAIIAFMAFTILYVAFELIRRKKLREEYALLWIITGFVISSGLIQKRLTSVYPELIPIL